MSLKSATHNSLGIYFRDKRIERGLTQGDVAGHLGYSSSQFVSNWERGLARPPVAAVKKLNKLLDLDVDKLLDLLLFPSGKMLRAAFMKWSKKGNI